MSAAHILQVSNLNELITENWTHVDDNILDSHNMSKIRFPNEEEENHQINK